MTKNKSTRSLELVRGVAVHEIEYLLKAKAYTRAHSFDELVVILFVAAHSHEDRGVTERLISEDLGFARSTANRILRVLLDGRQIVAIPETNPREFIYNFRFAEEVYGAKGVAIRNSFYVSTLKNLAGLCRTVIEKLALSQFDNRGD